MTNFEKIKSLDMEQMTGYLHENGCCKMCTYHPNCARDAWKRCKDGHKIWLESGVE